ncbi:MAG: Mur ligase family protein [Candidatus Cryptobacteroides sp.]|nr:Mur ligase family protein [Candidatus Cryptobacteroides sp.]
MENRNYNERIEELFRRHQSVQSAGFSSQAYKPGLDAIRMLDSRLGNPSSRLTVIHVAGTNGKGTVSSLLAALLASCGLRVGLYTSPHMLDFRERIKIVGPAANPPFRLSLPETAVTPNHTVAPDLSPDDSGLPVSEMIPREAVMQFLDIIDALPEQSYSFFEITTAMAFLWFAQSDTDCVVMECGLGGRLDSTNIVNPVLSIITSIGLDHCAILGGSRKEIAAEKAGIFKPGVPALVSGRDDETAPEFARIAAEKGSELFFADELVRTLPDLPYDAWSRLNAPTVIAALELLAQGDKGPASLVAAAGELTDLFAAACSSLDSAAGSAPGEAGSTAAAMENSTVNIESQLAYLQRVWGSFSAITGLRGRWECRRRGSSLYIFDIGHNPPALKENFERLGRLSGGGRVPISIVYGVMADKDVAGIAHLLPLWADYLLVAPDTPRAMPSASLLSLLSSLRPDLRLCDAGTVSAAIGQLSGAVFAAGAASAAAGTESSAAGPATSATDSTFAASSCNEFEPDRIIYIGGSTFVVAEALPLFNN